MTTLTIYMRRDVCGAARIIHTLGRQSLQVERVDVQLALVDVSGIVGLEDLDIQAMRVVVSLGAATRHEVDLVVRRLDRLVDVFKVMSEDLVVVAL